MAGQQDLTLPRPVTYDDYCQFPDDGKRYEILAGEIYVTPAPSPRHQYASKRLQRVLEQFFEGERACVVFAAPIDVILAPDDVVQPDLVVAEKPRISARGIEGPPLVLVEILSPSRTEYDRTTKARRYAARRVLNFWVVDPEARTLECFRLDESVYRRDTAAAKDDTLAVPAFDGLTLQLGDLWLAL